MSACALDSRPLPGPGAPPVNRRDAMLGHARRYESNANCNAAYIMHTNDCDLEDEAAAIGRQASSLAEGRDLQGSARKLLFDYENRSSDKDTKVLIEHDEASIIPACVIAMHVR